MARDMFRNTQSTLSSLDCEAARDGSVWETTMSHASKLWRVWYEDGDWHSDFGLPDSDRIIGEPQMPWLLVGRGPYTRVR
ncbi:Uncharacterised protein [Mycobacteroides abscessus subsp. abscessus]|nr:Uncharacterised protein [Mycobacteroides abscessus subsp. abscessus]